MDQVLADASRSPLPAPERALFAFIERVNARAAEIRREEVDALKEIGWSEEAIYDAITVSALFNFYNRWCDAAGVQKLPEEACRIAAKDMAAHGYTHEV